MVETQSDTIGREQSKFGNLDRTDNFALNPTTAHKQFNKQTNLLGGKGNVKARTFFKWHIDKNKARYDIGPISIYKPPAFVEDRIWKIARNHSIYVSVLFHTNKNSRLRYDERIAHGFILSDLDDYLLSYYVTGPTWKSLSVVLECLPYIVLFSSMQEYEWLNQIERFRKEWVQL